MVTAFVYSLTAGLFNSSNDLVFRSISTGGERNKLMSFYAVSAVSAAVGAVAAAGIAGTLGTLFLLPNILFGLLTGFLSFLAYLLYLSSFNGSNTSVAVTIYRMNMIPGVILAAAALGEVISLRRGIAILLCAASIIILMYERSDRHDKLNIRSLVYSVLACLLGGLLNTINRASMMYGATSLNVIFWRFVVVSVCVVLCQIWNKNSLFEKSELKRGSISGLFMIVAIFFILEALRDADVAFVIPLSQMLAIVLVTGVSIIFFKEGMNKRKIIGIFMALLAVFLIN